VLPLDSTFALPPSLQFLPEISGEDSRGGGGGGGAVLQLHRFAHIEALDFDGQMYSKPRPAAAREFKAAG